jgi:hypothetical protein
LMRFGHSQDHRPDLRQFKVALGTLDPVGLPLATATLSREQADDPHYLPVWDRLAATIGRPDSLVGDCKLASLANRAHIQAHGGGYLTPLPMTGTTPAELRAWVQQPPGRVLPIRLPAQEAHVGQGFTLAVPCMWTDPDTRTRVMWDDPRLVVQNVSDYILSEKKFEIQCKRLHIIRRKFECQGVLRGFRQKFGHDCRAGWQKRRQQPE